MTVSMLARAKVNLALHITGQRQDGYHLLDTLVAFPDIGDRISVDQADKLKLTIDGPFAETLSADSGENLVLKAAKMLGRDLKDRSQTASIHLNKNLPIASGLGGGSANAAAVLSALNIHWQLNLSAPVLADRAQELGADVPMCLIQKPLRAQGIGADISLQPAFPSCGMLLINPGVPISTPGVFKRLIQKKNSPLPELPKTWESFDHLVLWLGQSRNDLEDTACQIAPVIKDVLTWLNARQTCRFARMSGSGATCFGLFATVKDAEDAASAVRAERPGWWVGVGSI